MEISCFIESSNKHKRNHWGFSSAFISLLNLVMAKGRALFVLTVAFSFTQPYVEMKIAF
jgi:hypothetical protein